MGAAYGRHRNTNSSASGGAANSSYITYVGTGTTTGIVSFSIGGPGCSTIEPPTIEEAGIRAGEIIGYRAWLLCSDDNLHSMFMDYVWRPKETERVPHVHQMWGDGLHAFKSIKEARKQYGFMAGRPCSFSHLGYSCPVVFGEVAMWGEVIEHERGYRSEYAKVKSLDLLLSSPFRMSFIRRWRNRQKLNEVRERYGLKP